MKTSGINTPVFIIVSGFAENKHYGQGGAIGIELTMSILQSPDYNICKTSVK